MEHAGIGNYKMCKLIGTMIFIGTCRYGELQNVQTYWNNDLYWNMQA